MKLTYIIAFLTCFSLSSCATIPPIPPPVVIPCPKVECPRPVKPEIMKLDNTKPWNDQANIYILLNDLNDIVKYSKDQDGSLDCYDKSCGGK